MYLGGNLLTHYNYHRIDASAARNRDTIRIAIQSPDGAGDLSLTADLQSAARLPEGSIFPDVNKARFYAGPLPFTFDYEKETHSIIRIEGVRKSVIINYT